MVCGGLSESRGHTCSGVGWVAVVFLVMIYSDMAVNPLKILYIMIINIYRYSEGGAGF